MAGISSAYHLKKAGHSVVLIEREEVGGPSTGASSGVLYYGSGTNYVPATKLFGKEKADLLWKETAGVIQDLVLNARKYNIDCGVRTCGAIMVAKTPAEVAEIEEEQAAMKSDGFPTRLLAAREVKETYPLRDFLAGIAYDAVGQVHPARLGSGIAEANELEIYEETPSLEWKEDGTGVTVKTPAAEIRATNAVLATNYEPCFGFENHFEIESSVILASQPTDRVDDVFPTEKIIWTMEDKYDIVYPRGDRLILELYALGDEDKRLAYYFPGVEFTIEHQWGEVWSKPPDWIPILGKVRKNVAVAIGMGDQGIIMSWLSGSKMPRILDGKGDWFTSMASPQRFMK
jgi:gamma-glutamylputrescine oxidase